MVASTVSAFPATDKVETLWQMPDLSFGLYSGYLPIAGSQKQLHYMAALSQGNWKTDPVIIWFNGGPGCSSMLGFMQEHGPYSLNDGTTAFVKNQYSWNKEATMIYLESPAGVGFSLCPDPKECAAWNDFNTAEDNLAAFQQLLTVKFPELQSNDLYISGESYAGIYVPRLTQQIDWYIGNCTESKKCEYVPNLKGMIVGNGVTDYRYDNDLALLEMTFWYGIIATETYENIKLNCLVEPTPSKCDQWFQDVNDALANINIYDAFGKCWNNTESIFTQPSLYKNAKISQLLKSSGVDLQQQTPRRNYFTASDYTAFLKNPIGSKMGGKVGLLPPCVYAQPLIEYLNNATVRLQLNIPVSAPTWDLCNGDINKNYVKYPNGSIEIYENLRHKYRMLKYSGDTDMAVPTYGTRDWIDNLDWPISKEWKQFNVAGQVGGYSEMRDNNNFVFATIHGAGHMAPQWRSGPTYFAVFNFVHNKTF